MQMLEHSLFCRLCKNRAKRCEINNSANVGSSWITRVKSTFDIRATTHFARAETIAKRNAFPIRHLSPKKSPVSRTATTASFPFGDNGLLDFAALNPETKSTGSPCR
jgi:hypothetical protein